MKKIELKQLIRECIKEAILKEDKVDDGLITKNFGKWVEQLDMAVEKRSRKDIDRIIEKYCSITDPKNKLSTMAACNKLSKEDKNDMKHELLDLYYKEEY